MDRQKACDDLIKEGSPAAFSLLNWLVTPACEAALIDAAKTQPVETARLAVLGLLALDARLSAADYAALEARRPGAMGHFDNLDPVLLLAQRPAEIQRATRAFADLRDQHHQHHQLRLLRLPEAAGRPILDPMLTVYLKDAAPWDSWNTIVAQQHLTRKPVRKWLAQLPPRLRPIPRNAPDAQRLERAFSLIAQANQNGQLGTLRAALRHLDRLSLSVEQWEVLASRPQLRPEVRNFLRGCAPHNRDPDPGDARRLMGRVRPADAPTLRWMAAQRDPRFAFVGLDGLWRLEAPAPDLRGRRDERVRALSMMIEGDVPGLRCLAESSDVRVRAEALLGLGWRAPKTHAERLLRGLEDTERYDTSYEYPNGFYHPAVAACADGLRFIDPDVACPALLAAGLRHRGDDVQAVIGASLAWMLANRRPMATYHPWREVFLEVRAGWV